MSKWVIGILLLFVGESLFAQNNNKGKVSGVVIDSNDKSPVIQATVQILSLRDSSMIAGNATNLDGPFSISAPIGKYLLKVSFIGYKPTFTPITLTK